MNENSVVCSHQAQLGLVARRLVAEEHYAFLSNAPTATHAKVVPCAIAEDQLKPIGQTTCIGKRTRCQLTEHLCCVVRELTQCDKVQTRLPEQVAYQQRRLREEVLQVGRKPERVEESFCVTLGVVERLPCLSMYIQQR